jgi:hypothetical protein
MEHTVQTGNYGDVKLSGNEEDIHELVRRLRNDLIKDFLDERFLKEYLQSKYHIHEFSKVKFEFFRRDLKELYLSAINEIHYKPLLDTIRSAEYLVLTEAEEQIFYKEIVGILQKYFF